MENKKRNRSLNYTEDEKMLLLNLVGDVKHIIENKKTDAVNNKTKEECWLKISDQFNARAPNKTFRTTESLKKFYDNMKKKTRQEVANERMSHIQTGGGKEYKIPDEAHSLALTLMNPKTVVGLNTKYDDDALDTAEEYMVLEVPGEIQPANVITEKEQSKEDLPLNYEVNTDTVTWKNWSASTLQTPTTTSLKRPNKNIDGNDDSGNSWTKRRRPGVKKDAENHYVELAKAKLELVQLQKDSFLESERIRKDRETIEFNLRKTALEFDVKLKQIQLEKLESQK